MRAKLNITEGIFPMPVLMIATYNEDGSVNVMNAAWGTMQARDVVALNLSEGHKTVKNIKARGAFTVSIADAAHVTEADYFGVESGNHVADKLAASGLTASKAETVDAPVINEFPICLECQFLEYQDGEYGCGVISGAAQGSGGRGVDCGANSGGRGRHAAPALRKTPCGVCRLLQRLHPRAFLSKQRC